MSPELPRLPKAPFSPREIGDFAQLLFEWPIRQAPRLTLPLCIVLAALVQMAMVVIFSVSYEAPVAKLKLSPRFYFLPADSSASRQLGPWLDANDPALFFPGRATASAFPPPPPLQYRPSYEEPPPPLRPLPEQEPPLLEPPPPVPLGTLEEAFRRRATTPPLPMVKQEPDAPSAPLASPVRWLDELAARVFATGYPAELPSRISATKPSLYQVQVGPEGVPMHGTLIDSSGNAEADEAGCIWIMASRFQPAGSASWGRVLIFWDPSVKSTPASPAQP